MATNSTLVITDPTGVNGTFSLGTLNATNAGNTVVYICNPWTAKECDYYNLVFANTNYVDSFPPYYPYEDFNNFSQNGPTPITILGDMTLMGHTRVRQGSGGSPITIKGNLTIGAGCAWDSSGDYLTVVSNVYVYGTLEDLNAALGSNYIGGNVLVSGPATHTPDYLGGDYTNGWYVSDVTTWGVGGSLTNNGAMWGGGYGSISFNGTGVIVGTNSLKIPTMTVNGTYTIGTTITLTTNTPTLNGTLVFDLAAAPTNEIILLHNSTNPPTFYYSGNLNVINSGAAPGPGNSYQFFSASNYDGAFTATNYPSLPGGLYWIDNLLASGLITVGGSAGTPSITLTRSGILLTLSWDSATYPGYSVLKLTNSAGVITDLTHTWQATGSNTSPATFTVSPGGPPTFFRLSHP